MTRRLSPCCRRFARPAALALGLLAIWAQGARAAPSEDEPDREFRLSGDWGGLRTRLRDAGWTFQLREKFEAAANLQGGERRLGIGAGELRIGAAADLDKLFGLGGGEFQITFTDRHGGSLSPKAGLGLLQPAIEVHGRGDRWRLTQLWYQQDLAGGDLNLRAGRMNPGTDFHAFACAFQNLTFCGSQPGNLAGDYWYNWPVSQWGLRLKRRFASGYLEAGAYQVSRKNVTDEVRLSPSGGDGVLLPVEIAWTPKLGPARLPGTFKLGAWYSTARRDDVLLDVAGRPRSLTGAPARARGGGRGVYVSVEQQVTGAPDGRGLGLFLNATRTDRKTTRLDRQIAAGLNWTGPFAARGQDVLGLAFGATRVNPRAALARRLAGERAPRTEYVAEVDYRVQGPKGLTVTPNLQWVENPGGLDRKAAVVAGLKVIVGL